MGLKIEKKNFLLAKQQQYQTKKSSCLSLPLILYLVLQIINYILINQLSIDGSTKWTKNLKLSCCKKWQKKLPGFYFCMIFNLGNCKLIFKIIKNYT